MSRLNLILGDCYPSPVNPQVRAALPRLPALEFCFSRGDVARIPAGWQRWLAVRHGGASLAGAALGGIAAAGYLGLKDSRHYWLATPVNYVAGIDNLRLHPAGLLRLAPGEQQHLAQDFARVFAGSGWELMATGQRDLLLAGPAQPSGASVDPARLLGMDPSAASAAGTASVALRRLASECEMWLHEHPVNRARSTARLLTVSGLWLWGGGAAVDPVPRRELQYLADDIYVTSLARLTGATLAALPTAWEQTAPGESRAEVTAVCLLAGESAVNELLRIEQDWLLPMLSQWRAGHWSELAVMAGERVATLSRASRWRWWRRANPWWESLFAC